MYNPTIMMHAYFSISDITLTILTTLLFLFTLRGILVTFGITMYPNLYTQSHENLNIWCPCLLKLCIFIFYTFVFICVNNRCTNSNQYYTTNYELCTSTLIDLTSLVQYSRFSRFQYLEDIQCALLCCEIFLSHPSAMITMLD